MTDGAEDVVVVVVVDRDHDLWYYILYLGQGVAMANLLRTDQISA